MIPPSFIQSNFVDLDCDSIPSEQDDQKAQIHDQVNSLKYNVQQNHTRLGAATNPYRKK